MLDKLFPRRNELVSLKGNSLSLNARKTLDYIYKEGIRIYKENKEYGIFKINIANLKKEIGMNRTSDYSQIKEELIQIQKLEFETYDNKHYSKFPILAGFNITDDGLLEVALSPFLIRMIFDNKNPYYHFANLMDYKELKSKYSKIILDLYSRYKDVEIPKMNIEKFQDILQYSKNYRNNDIKTKVLEQAKKELEKCNKLNLTWEIELLGRKWNYIKLNVVPLEEDEIEIEFSTKIEKAILKARKNKFIAEKFSRKAMEKIVSKYEEKYIIKALTELYLYNKEIINFSKILTAKIEEIKDSKVSKTKVIKDVPVEDVIEKKSKLELEKERISIDIRESGLPTRQRIELMSKLAKIDNLNELKTFKIKGD